MQKESESKTKPRFVTDGVGKLGYAMGKGSE